MLTYDEALQRKAELIARLKDQVGDIPFYLKFELIRCYVDLLGETDIPSFILLEKLLQADETTRFVTPADIRRTWRETHSLLTSAAYRLLLASNGLGRPTETSLRHALQHTLEQHAAQAAELAEPLPHENPLATLSAESFQGVTLEELSNVWEFCLRNGLPPFDTGDSRFSIH